MDAEGVEKYLVPKMGFTKVAYMAVNNDWGRGSTVEFSTVIKRSGGQVGAVEFINQEATDFLTQLTMALIVWVFNSAALITSPLFSRVISLAGEKRYKV